MKASEILANHAVLIRQTRLPQYCQSILPLGLLAAVVIPTNFPWEIKPEVWAAFPLHVEYLEKQRDKIRENASKADKPERGPDSWNRAKRVLLVELAVLSNLYDALAKKVHEKELADKWSQSHGRHITDKLDNALRAAEEIFKFPGQKNTRSIAACIGLKSQKSFGTHYAPILKAAGFVCGVGIKATWRPPKSLTHEQVKQAIKDAYTGAMVQSKNKR